MNLASRTAGTFTSIAIIWFVFAVTRSAIAVTILGVAEALTGVAVTFPAGVWIDRLSRRRLLLFSNAGAGAAVLFLAVISARYGFDFVAVIVVSVALAAFTELYRSTNHSILPEIVDGNELPSANGVTQAGTSLLGSASSVLGGALFTIAGAVSVFFCGGVCYAAAAALSSLVASRSPAPSHQTETGRESSMAAETKEGIVWLVSQRGLLMLSVSSAFSNFLVGIIFNFLVIYVAVGLTSNASVYGGLLALFVIGNAIGSLLAGRTRLLTSAGKLWVLNSITEGILILVLGRFPLLMIATAVMTAIGVMIGLSNNLWLTSAQNLVPQQMRGRYFAVDGLISYIGVPLSIVVGGILILMIGVASTYELGGILLLMTAIGFAFAKSLRTLDGTRAMTTDLSIG